VGLSGPVPARVPAEVKELVLKTVDDAVAAGFAHTWVCSLWRVSDSRVHRWRARHRDTGTLVDRAPGGAPIHALTPEEITAVLDIAAEGDIVWADVSKPIGGGSEKYRPSHDVDGHVAEVRYGAASGLDEINQNVMVLQQLGARIIDRRTAMEMSPFVEDPQRVEKRMLKETMQDAMLAGLAMQAQQGAIDSFTLAMIDQAIESDEVSLSEAIAAFAPQAPLAPPAGAPGPPPEAPGVAGAAEGPQESNMPPLAELLGP
jgi:hypothetical protein